MRVLVVEDSAEQGETLRVALRGAGCDVAAAQSVSLETLDRLQPDLVVLNAESLKAILDALALASRRLEERKLVERAKGLLMKAHGLDEEAAYRALRSMAMNENRRIGEVARSVIGMTHLLG